MEFGHGLRDRLARNAPPVAAAPAVEEVEARFGKVETWEEFDAACAFVGVTLDDCIDAVIAGQAA